MRIEGYATVEGTKKYFEKLNLNKSIIRENKYFYSTPMAMGTFIGDFSDEDSKKYEESLTYGINNGVNFIDTAICYRGMRSERDVGKVLKKLILEEEKLEREEIIISTKAGIIFGDILEPIRPVEYLNKVLIGEGILKKEDVNITEEFKHTLNPRFYEHAIERSKENLGLETIDINYIHEPEASKSVLGEKVFYKELEKLLEFYEGQVEKGNIVNYGMATWDGFITDESSKEYLSLEKVIEIAKKVAGNRHHFKFVQLNYNKVKTNANTFKNQSVNGKKYTAIDAANELGILVNVNGPLNQMKWKKSELYSPKEMIEFVLDTKGIYAAMIGNKEMEHLRHNMSVVFDR